MDTGQVIDLILKSMNIMSKWRRTKSRRHDALIWRPLFYVSINRMAWLIFGGISHDNWEKFVNMVIIVLFFYQTTKRWLNFDVYI